MGKKKKSGKKQLNKWDDDHYTKLARKENYPARSVYKLKEIDQKFKIFKKGLNVLDLGCAPGAWLKYASEKVGPSGKVTGIDLKPVELEPLANMEIIKGDIFEQEVISDLISKGMFDIVMSDMAPDTTGYRHADSARSAALCEAALYLGSKVLKKGGVFITKIFQGEDFDQFAKKVLLDYEKRKIFKPDSCRKNSKEVYIIGSGKK
ncbi:MAG: RlmE family RNA methyltransferase [Thermodesulfobacteriota bacterium]